MEDDNPESKNLSNSIDKLTEIIGQQSLLNQKILDALQDEGEENSIVKPNNRIYTPDHKNLRLKEKKQNFQKPNAESKEPSSPAIEKRRVSQFSNLIAWGLVASLLCLICFLIVGYDILQSPKNTFFGANKKNNSTLNSSKEAIVFDDTIEYIEKSRELIREVFDEKNSISHISDQLYLPPKKEKLVRYFNSNGKRTNLVNLKYQGHTRKKQERDFNVNFLVQTTKNNNLTPTSILVRKGELKFYWPPFFQIQTRQFDVFNKKETTDEEQFYVFLRKRGSYTNLSYDPTKFMPIEIIISPFSRVQGYVNLDQMPNFELSLDTRHPEKSVPFIVILKKVKRSLVGESKLTQLQRDLNNIDDTSDIIIVDHILEKGWDNMTIPP